MLNCYGSLIFFPVDYFINWDSDCRGGGDPRTKATILSFVSSGSGFFSSLVQFEELED